MLRAKLFLRPETITSVPSALNKKLISCLPVCRGKIISFGKEYICGNDAGNDLLTAATLLFAAELLMIKLSIKLIDLPRCFSNLNLNLTRPVIFTRMSAKGRCRLYVDRHNLTAVLYCLLQFRDNFLKNDIFLFSFNFYLLCSD